MGSLARLRSPGVWYMVQVMVASVGTTLKSLTLLRQRSKVGRGACVLL